MNAPHAEPLTGQQLALLAQLGRSRVQFILVGGAAGRVHGATLPTDNVDVLVRNEPANLARLATALARLDAYLTSPGRDPAHKLRPYSDPVPEHVWRRHWQTPEFGRLNVMYGMVDGTGVLQPYSHYTPRITARDFDHDGETVKVRVAGLIDIVASRGWARRQRDREALPEIRALLREQRADQGMAPARRGRAPRELRRPLELDHDNDNELGL